MTLRPVVSRRRARCASPRHKHAAVVLRDGRVLVVGGSDVRDFRGRYRSTEVWSAATGRFDPAPALREPRFKLPDAVVALRPGRSSSPGAARPSSGSAPGGTLRDGRATFGGPFMFATATVLPGGRVLVAGGYDDSITPTAGAWLYRSALKGSVSRTCDRRKAEWPAATAAATLVA